MSKKKPPTASRPIDEEAKLRDEIRALANKPPLPYGPGHFRQFLIMAPAALGHDAESLVRSAEKQATRYKLPIPDRMPGEEAQSYLLRLERWCHAQETPARQLPHDQSSDGIDWSEPKTLDYWARQFRVKPRTIARWRDAKPPKLRMKKVGSLFCIPLADMPPQIKR